MDEYKSLRVYSVLATEKFGECVATVAPNGTLIVIEGGRSHVWASGVWQKIEAEPLVRA